MPGRKRKSAPAAEEPPAAADAPATRRRSLRVSSTGQKSKYFEAGSESDADRDGNTQKRGRGKGRPSKKVRVEVESDENEDDYKEEDEDDGDEPGTAGTANRDAEESDEEFDEDAPPKVTFIPHIKLRDTNGIEYEDHTVHPNTLAFLRDLKANNKRSWLKAHDAEYRRALKDWESFVTTLMDKIIAADPTIPELPFKDVNFRIYRDIRFSNDPTPYKPHFSAAFSRTGRKGPYACYYVHLEPTPGSSFVGGGLWHPDGGALQRLRASIDERPGRWRRVLNEGGFKGRFLGLGVGGEKVGGGGGGKGRKGGRGRKGGEDGDGDGGSGGGEEQALKAFAEKNKEGALKTRPKGFNPEHRDMQLLKLKNFTVGTKVGEKLFTEAGSQEQIGQIVGDMVGFITHLNRIVMPDPGDDDDDDDEDEAQVEGE
ncbi:hypothetical protein F5144DRAFT_659828 [Chaetomium tenue]|uniref:Uncharacterized protein n=1 Tax=Chaetomium tenue TaxID=1854479 RepID=A0ACB7NWJ7_9PEZI|nr:hypothetical protein F5144DRAFT_659828 [Chaetomium globosum]